MKTKQDWIALLAILAVVIPVLWLVVHLIRKASG